MDLALALKVSKLNQMPGPWVHKVDDNWTIAVNGLKEPRRTEPEGCMFVTLQPYEAAFWWNGWLAGLCGPGGGTIAAHPSGANEDRLIADMKAATARAKAGQ